MAVGKGFMSPEVEISPRIELYSFGAELSVGRGCRALSSLPTHFEHFYSSLASEKRWAGLSLTDVKLWGLLCGNCMACLTKKWSTQPCFKQQISCHGCPSKSVRNALWSCCVVGARLQGADWCVLYPLMLRYWCCPWWSILQLTTLL